MQLNALFHAILAGVAISATSVSAACVNVSVEADATYCINGPICSGSGSTPAGLLCPSKGAVAVKDCSNNKLPSWTSAGACVAPADAVCAKIKTGAWGCVYTAKATVNATSTGIVTPPPTTTAKSSNTTTNSTVVTPAPTTTTAKLNTTTTNSTTAVTPAPTTTVKSSNTTINSTPVVTPAPTTTTAKLNTTTNSTAAVTPAPTTTVKSGNATTGTSSSVTPTPAPTTVKSSNTTANSTISNSTTTYNSTATSNSTTAPVKVSYALTESGDTPGADASSSESTSILVGGAAVGAVAAIAVFVARKRRQRAAKTEFLDNVYHGTVPTPL